MKKAYWIDGRLLTERDLHDIRAQFQGFKRVTAISDEKAKALKALQRLHERAAAVTRDRIWTRAYILRLEPPEAAELAAREYDATHPPAWVKRRR